MQYLIAIAIIVLPFVWLYEKLGAFGFWTLIVLVVASIIYWFSSSAKRNRVKFQELALSVFNNRLPPSEVKAITRSLMKSNPVGSELIRNLQIVGDSIDIALSSKQRDVAESRMDLALKLFNEIKQKHTHLLDADTMSIIERTVPAADIKFQTDLYLNVAQGHIEKAGKLKTEKARQKYKQQARDIIMEGLNNPRSNKKDLKEFEI